MDREAAAQILAKLNESRARIFEALTLARQHCSAEELKTFVKGVGLVLGELELELCQPAIYSKHPDLRQPLPDDDETRAAVARISARLSKMAASPGRDTRPDEEG